MHMQRHLPAPALSRSIAHLVGLATVFDDAALGTDLSEGIALIKPKSRMATTLLVGLDLGLIA